MRAWACVQLCTGHVCVFVVALVCHSCGCVTCVHFRVHGVQELYCNHLILECDSLLTPWSRLCIEQVCVSMGHEYPSSVPCSCSLSSFLVLSVSLPLYRTAPLIPLHVPTPLLPVVFHPPSPHTPPTHLKHLATTRQPPGNHLATTSERLHAAGRNRPHLALSLAHREGVCVPPFRQQRVVWEREYHGHRC